jgi:mannose-6-phosphate isomerase
VDRLENRIQPYAWGSRTAIAELVGEPSPSPDPQAELWMGAHPSAPSRVWRGGAWRSLFDVIGANPEEELGAAACARFGARLPFLFKVLAAETPLSLQAHPSVEQARAGYAAEERAGISLAAAERNYRDQNHKPELVCALGPFDALCGFRPLEGTRQLLARLGVRELEDAARELDGLPPSRALFDLFSWVMSQSGRRRDDLIAATLAQCARLRDRGEAFATECDWAVRIGKLYPGDVGVVVALLLNWIRLMPGDALYLPAGQLHAYLGGVAIEIMANSDNVLRAGLTPKHVDLPELLRILQFTEAHVALVEPAGKGAERAYLTPTPEFRLSRIVLDGATNFRVEDRRGPEILLCVEGIVRATNIATASGETLSRGHSVFLSATDPTYELSGAGTVFRATVGEL